MFSKIPQHCQEEPLLNGLWMCAGLLVSQSLTVIVKVISRFPGQKHEEDSDDDMADELLGHELFADYLSGAP
jgi:hypothetical protein